MSVVVRLKRMGSNRRPSYRVVVADSRKPRDGRFIEIIGFYNPLTDPAQVELKTERVDYWLKKGARLSQTVNSLYKKARASSLKA